MPTVKLLTDAEISANPRLQAVFDDIRATRKSDFVNNFWRALANQPALLERTWSSIKQVMIAPGVLDPLTKELIYIAVSVTNNCSYCIHSHTAAARAKGLTDQQHDELLAVIGVASETNALATPLQVPSTRSSQSNKLMTHPYIGRLAPIPSGLLHLSDAATFWQAFFRARDHNGALLFRNEDLDPALQTRIRRGHDRRSRMAGHRMAATHHLAVRPH